MAQPVIKRRGNPNFPLKKGNNNEVETSIPELNTVDLNKQYIFQLLKTHDKAKPRDPNTNEITGSPYQPFWAAINSGTAWDPDYIPMVNGLPKKGVNPGAVRRWRFLSTYPTIWVDEQIDPEPSKEDLAAPENDLVFRQGMLRVFAHETMKLKALKLNNGFKDCERPLKNVPKDYELINQDKIDKEVLQVLDDAFEAEKAARSATLEEMYSVAFYFGIDLGRSDEAIRKDFINKARQNPKSFNTQFVNPKNKYKYVFLSAIADNIISGDRIPGKLVYVETDAHLFDLKTGDYAEELANMCMGNQTVAMNLYHKLDKILNEEVA